MSFSELQEIDAAGARRLYDASVTIDLISEGEVFDQFKVDRKTWELCEYVSRKQGLTAEKWLIDMLTSHVAEAVSSSKREKLSA